MKNKFRIIKKLNLIPYMKDMKLSKNQNTIISENELYRAKEVTEEHIKEHIKKGTSLCYLCDLYSQNCQKVPCLKSDRIDNKETIFQFIKFINEK